MECDRCKMMQLFFKNTILVRLICDVHPWSHTIPMNNSALLGKLGNTCAILDPSGKNGSNNLQVCGETMRFPSNSLAGIG